MDEKKDVIESAGLLDKLLNLIDKIFDKIDGWAPDEDTEVKLPDGSLVYEMVSEDKKFRFKCKLGRMHLEHNNADWDDSKNPMISTVDFKTPDGKIYKDVWDMKYDPVIPKDADENWKPDKSTQWVPNEESQKEFNKILEKFKNSVLKDIENKAYSSNRMNITLKKITSGDSIDVQLVSVNACDYSAIDGYNDMMDIIQSDEFVELLPEDAEVTYDVISDPESLSYCEYCEDEIPVKPMADCLVDILRVMFPAIQNLKWLKINLFGQDNKGYRDILDSFSWTLDYNYERFAEMVIEFGGNYPNPLEFIGSDSVLFDRGLLSVDPGTAISTVIRDIISSLNFYYGNMPSDVQMVFDTLIRDLSHVVDYSLKDCHGYL